MRRRHSIIGVKLDDEGHRLVVGVQHTDEISPATYSALEQLVRAAVDCLRKEAKIHLLGVEFKLDQP